METLKSNSQTVIILDNVQNVVRKASNSEAELITISPHRIVFGVGYLQHRGYRFEISIEIESNAELAEHYRFLGPEGIVFNFTTVTLHVTADAVLIPSIFLR